MNKLTSRKFWVWIVWTGVVLISYKNLTPELINGWSIVSALYIGGNVAGHWIGDKHEGKKGL